MKNSVLIIGIDGATWNLLKPWIKKGDLPTLKKLIDKGSEGNLKTVIPPLSCSAWTSLFTGTNPGKHGIFEYLTKSGKLINSTMIKSEKIWNILSQYGKRCCIIGVPVTYPVEEINGYMVSSVLTPPDVKIYSHPPELMNLLKKHSYKTNIKYEKNTVIPEQKNINERKYKILEESYDLFNRKYLTVKDLMKEPWDFFMFVFGESATSQYLFWDKKEIILEFFKKIDACIDDLIKTFSANNHNPHVFIVSDHGFNASPKRSFNFRAWLNENGFIDDKRSLLQKIIPKFYRKLNKTPLSKLIFLFNKSREIRESFQRKSTESLSIYYRNGLFIDKSQLKDNNYEKLREDIIEKLKCIKYPLTDDSPFQIIEKREDVYSGDNLEYAPDIVFVPKENYNLNFYDSDKVFDDVELPMSGRHSSDLYGIFLACGDEIQSGNIKNISILDIFPTVLHILDVPISRNGDGKVLKEIFKEDSDLFNKEIIFSKEEDRVTVEEKNRIKNNLKNIKI